MQAVFFLGIDVSKNSLSAHLRAQSKDNPLWSNKNVPNTEGGFRLIEETALKKIRKLCNEPFTVAIGMESPGVYGERLAHYFYGRGGFAVYVLNPAAVRSFARSAMARNKNDSADAGAIASYMLLAMPERIVAPWAAPLPEESLLNGLSRRRDELVSMRTMENNRLEKWKNKAEPSDEGLSSIERSVAFLEGEIKKIEAMIKGHIDSHPGIRKNTGLMRTIPGIGETCSVVIESQTNGLSKFTKVRQLTAYAGLSVTEHASGTSVMKRPHIDKRGNSRIRRVLYMCAVSAIRANPVIKDFYSRLLGRGKCKKLAIVACMRKLLHIIWGVVKHGRAFSPECSS